MNNKYSLPEMLLHALNSTRNNPFVEHEREVVRTFRDDRSMRIGLRRGLSDAVQDMVEGMMTMNEVQINAGEVSGGLEPGSTRAGKVAGIISEVGGPMLEVVDAAMQIQQGGDPINVMGGKMLRLGADAVVGVTVSTLVGPMTGTATSIAADFAAGDSIELTGQQATDAVTHPRDYIRAFLARLNMTPQTLGLTNSN